MPEPASSHRLTSGSRVAHLRLMAGYNQWMNAQLYRAAGTLPAAELAADRKAFFGSLLGTLNHVMVADIIWLKRFAGHPAAYASLEPVRALPHPTALAQLLHEDFAELSSAREALDRTIVAWADEVAEGQLDEPLEYVTMRDRRRHRRAYFSLAMHFFNHQAHHRGQATTLLSQAGVDVGVTDLLVRIPDLD